MNAIKWENDGTGCFALKRECSLCGQEFEYICPRDYYTESWHNHFGCCTHDCMERQFDYDLFKAETKPKYTQERYFKLRESLWRIWVEEKAMSTWQPYFTPEGLWRLELDIAKSIGVQRYFMELGFDREFAEYLAFV